MLTPFAPGIWLASDPIRIVGMKLSATMAVIRLDDGTLLLFSPVRLTDARLQAVSALGRVAHIYAPNTYHHTWAAAWADAFPDACVHGPRALASKRQDLRIDRHHDHDALGGLARDFQEIHVDGFALEETVLVHRATGTLLVADLVHNIGRPTHWWTVAYSKAMGFYDRVAISRMIRLGAFNDRRAARASIDRLRASSFDRLIVGHGAPLAQGAHAAIEQAYGWLGSNRALVPARRRPLHGRCG